MQDAAMFHPQNDRIHNSTSVRGPAQLLREDNSVVEVHSSPIWHHYKTTSYLDKYFVGINQQTSRAILYLSAIDVNITIDGK